jgi:hypothetical protein
MKSNPEEKRAMLKVSQYWTLIILQSHNNKNNMVPAQKQK